MAIAHVCLGCGKDLARIRAAIEPHYGLPIVTCPACGAVCVRRVHPQWRTWRRVLRLGSSLAALFLKIAVAVILAYMTIAVAGLFRATLTDEDPPIDRTSPRAMLVLAALVLAISILDGAWLAAALGHVARRRAWIGWCVFVVACMAAFVLIIVTTDPSHEQIRLLILEVLGTIPIIAGMLVVALAGVPLGILIVSSRIRQRSSRWRRRRARLRLQRTGG